MLAFLKTVGTTASSSGTKKTVRHPVLQKDFEDGVERHLKIKNEITRLQEIDPPTPYAVAKICNLKAKRNELQLDVFFNMACFMDKSLQNCNGIGGTRVQSPRVWISEAMREGLYSSGPHYMKEAQWWTNDVYKTKIENLLENAFDGFTFTVESTIIGTTINIKPRQVTFRWTSIPEVPIDKSCQ